MRLRPRLRPRIPQSTRRLPRICGVWREGPAVGAAAASPGRGVWGGVAGWWCAVGAHAAGDAWAGVLAVAGLGRRADPGAAVRRLASPALRLGWRGGPVVA